MAYTDHFDADDAAHMLEDLGEPVVYVKGSVDPVERRPINAIVHRQPNRFDREKSNGASTAKVKPIRIVFANDALTGISAAELDLGQDRIELETAYGDATSKRALKLHMPRETERTLNDARFHTFELY